MCWFFYAYSTVVNRYVVVGLFSFCIKKTRRTKLTATRVCVHVRPSRLCGFTLGSETRSIDPPLIVLVRPSFRDAFQMTRGVGSLNSRLPFLTMKIKRLCNYVRLAAIQSPPERGVVDDD